MFSVCTAQVDAFLEKKLARQIGTIDDGGYANIQLVWFNYDKRSEKFLIVTPKTSRKIKNLREKPHVYFSIDDESFPYKGVKGRGTAAVVEDPSSTVHEAK